MYLPRPEVRARVSLMSRFAVVMCALLVVGGLAIAQQGVTAVARAFEIIGDVSVVVKPKAIAIRQGTLTTTGNPIEKWTCPPGRRARVLTIRTYIGDNQGVSARLVTVAGETLLLSQGIPNAVVTANDLEGVYLFPGDRLEFWHQYASTSQQGNPVRYYAAMELDGAF